MPGAGSGVEETYSETDAAMAALTGDGYSPGYTPVVPDTSFIDLSGQFISIPGGSVANGATHISDSSGINAIYKDPAVNPVPTGGYMTALAQVANAAMQSFTTFIKGSPSVATPGAKLPTGATVGGGLLVNAQGQTNWLLIGGVAVVGIGIIAYLVHSA